MELILAFEPFFINLKSTFEDTTNLSITVPSSSVNILASWTDKFSDKNTDIKSKNKDDLSFVTIVTSKKLCLLIFLIT